MSLIEAPASKLSSLDGWFRYHMPYAFHHLPSFSGNVWLPLNRNYKPLGQLDKTEIVYDDYVKQAVSFSRDPRTFEHIWLEKRFPEILYLYDDGTESRRDYFARLERLLSYKLKLTPEAKEATGVRYAE